MQTLPSFLQSLFLYALTSPASTVLRNSIPDRKTSVSHNTPKADTQNVFAEKSQYFNFFLELIQRAQREEVRRQNLRRLKYDTWIKRKTALQKFKSKHGHSYFPRASRARLDRMPLAFGKRAESQRWEREVGDMFERGARDRIHRMPLTFGKRFLNGMHLDAKAAFVVDVPKVDSYDQISSDGHNGPFLKRQNSRLTRMPITFGKRIPIGIENYLLDNSGPESRKSADNENWQEGSFTRERRTSLSRMPLTFGRKKKTLENQEKSVRQGANQENQYNVLSGRENLLLTLVEKLTSGDAKKPSKSSLVDVKSNKLHSNEVISKDDVIPSATSPERNLEMHRSDLAGDTIRQISSMYLYPYDALPVEQRAVMNTMPLTFGKRNGPLVDRRPGEQYGRGDQAADAEKTASGQRKRWLYEDHGDGDESERDLRKTRKRSGDDHIRVLPDRDEWNDDII